VHDLDVVERLRVEDRDAVFEHPRHVRQVRVERPAEGDVHDLESSADAQGRHAQAISGDEQRDLEFVAVGLHAVQVRLVGCPPVSRGIDVAAADQHQAVEWLEQLLWVPVLTGRDDRRAGAGASEGIDVRPGHAVPPVGPSRDPVVPEVVGDHGDERAIAHARPRATSTNRRNVWRPRRSWSAM
jgi:hypothetical protein